jgi:hypothetical protein
MSEKISKSSSARNIHFLACNFAASAEEVLSSLPADCVRLISFQVDILCASIFGNLREGWSLGASFGKAVLYVL